ncbi:MAG: glycosyltransferase [Planctomycetota bacterium]|jgi:trehalose synthase
MGLLEQYAKILRKDMIDQLCHVAEPLKGMKIVHVNSTKEGGGVAEILHKMVPLMNELGLDSSWEVITGEREFYECTKGFHNALQGNRVAIPESRLKAYEKTNARNADALREKLEAADAVFIHDPQPAPLLKLCPKRKGKWVWRCHIDLSHPHRPVWRYLRKYLVGYNASIFSLAGFAPELPHAQYLIPPSIDPLSEKNMDLPEKEIMEVYPRFNLDPNRPMILQVSRFDHFKDPVGVIEAYRLAKRFIPTLQLVLAGGGASDDPEGAMVLDEVRMAAQDDPDIHILLLPSDAHRTVNALQRAADIVLQKSLKEGFALTVTEALWKGKPVIGGDVGGITLQVHDYNTGFLVRTVEGAAIRIRWLLRHPKRMKRMGERAHEFARENFLLTRHVSEHLILLLGLMHGTGERIELS